jgi:kojibiose phosphorylase/nigerose phosphorylase
MKWEIIAEGYPIEAIADNGNRFLVGNGYMGIRGTLDECDKTHQVAINLAGIYDKVGDGWREPLNAPNPLFTQVFVDGSLLSAVEEKDEVERLRHEMSLDYRYGVFSRESTWEVSSKDIGKDTKVTIQSSRFASMADPHLIGLKYSVMADKPMTIKLKAGIDGEVWDIHGPHFKALRFESSADDQTIHCEAFVQNGKDRVAVVRKNVLSGANALNGAYDAYDVQYVDGVAIFTIDLKAGVPVELTSVCSIWHTGDCEDPMQAATAQIRSLAAEVSQMDAYDLYVQLLNASQAKWDEVWKVSDVTIEGDEEAQQAMLYSLYHLNIAAPRHKDNLSIPARALSGQTYKGAIFWDSELFMLDYFLYTQPEVARSLVKYRIDTLGGALEKAKHYGFEGAFYAWESQEGGFDACSDHNVTDVFTGRPVRTYFKDKQLHISSAVVWAIMHYYDYTKDLSILMEGGADAIVACATFYRSAMVRPLHRDRYELHDVIGPDEYHERVGNNAYTNAMAHYSICAAIAVIDLLKIDKPETYAALLDARDKLYLPKPNRDGIIEQFDGYFRLEDISPDVAKSRLKHPLEYWGGGNGVASDTQVIKQADVITMLEMHHEAYDEKTLAANWAYYEPRTEHGSSLSACMYAMVACRFGDPDLAYPFFMKSATAEIRGGGKQWAGLVYIGGTHPAASGGAYKNLVQGFAGFEIKDGVPNVKPNLPSHWKSLKFAIAHDHKMYQIEVDHEKATIRELPNE